MRCLDFKILLGAVGLVGSTSWAGNQSVSLQIFGPERQFVMATLSGVTSFGVERSTALSEWSPHLIAFSDFGDLAFVDRPLGLEPLPERAFYRAVPNNLSPSALSARWTANNIRRYRFDFRRAEFWEPRSGTVTVQDGQVVAVENAMRFPGETISNPNLADFLSVEQLFEFIAQEAPTSDQLVIRFDNILFYPKWIDSNPWRNVADDEAVYFVENLQVIE